MTPIDRQTDRQTKMAALSMSKSTRWAFTLQYDPEIYGLLDQFVHKPSLVPAWKDIIAEIGWQDEIAPTTGQQHRQGYIRTVRQCRLSQMKKILETAHFEVARDWLALKQYCSKADTRDPSGNVVKFVQPNKFGISQLLIRIASVLLEHGHTDHDDHQSTMYWYHDNQSKQYWTLASFLLEEDPELAGIIGQPLPQNLWKNCRATWIKLAQSQAEEAPSEAISITASPLPEFNSSDLGINAHPPQSYAPLQADSS